MWSLDLRIAQTLYIVVSALISLFVIFNLHYVVDSDILNSVTSASSHSEEEQVLPQESTDPAPDNDVGLVVASMKHENSSWLSIYFPDWKKDIYVVDDPTAPLTVPKNKGRESMVYLTYIIDHYDNLPANLLFLHAERFQWHNDDPDYDGVPLLRNFQLPYLQEEGYVNLRCVWSLGCPAEVRPFDEDSSTAQHDDRATGEIYKQVFEELLRELSVPVEVGVSCCAQFAVTRDTIHQRQKEDYVRFREWLLQTPLQDALSGRFFEYSWHIIFGKSPVYCPNAPVCYCKVYGMCDLPNCSINECKGHYTLPQYATLPQGWPRVGWDGEERPFSGPL